MIVKICGITRAEDAQAAVEAGAQAVGFIFWNGSPRFVDPAKARTIVRTLPPFVTAVGVFVNQTIEEIESIAGLSGIGALQLHGDEDAAFASRLSRPVIRAVGQVSAALTAWPPNVMLLVDAHDPVRRGGTGMRADWNGAAALARTRRIILAGGLDAENVAAAVLHVRPFGIDVSSGVESAPGIKDHRRIQALFQALQVS